MEFFFKQINYMYFISVSEKHFIAREWIAPRTCTLILQRPCLTREIVKNLIEKWHCFIVYLALGTGKHQGEMEQAWGEVLLSF